MTFPNVFVVEAQLRSWSPLVTSSLPREKVFFYLPRNHRSQRCRPALCGLHARAALRELVISPTRHAALAMGNNPP